jgi:hypothetical protein
MAINYTSLLGLAQPVTGTEANTWGTVVNDEITALIEEAIAGGETINVTSGDVTLTDTDGVANQARNAILLVTGTPGTARSILAPNLSKVYVVRNGSDSTVTIKGVTGPTTGVAVLSGQTALVIWNGSDFETVSSGDVDGPASSTDEAVARFNGTTGKLLQNSVVTITDAGIMGGITQLNVDNLRLDGNTISTTDSNGNLTFAPNGTGYGIFSGTQAVLVPKGNNTTERPGTPVTGMLRYNTTSDEFEGYSGASASWKSVGGAAISNDTSTASDLYPAFLTATTGTASTINTSNAKLLYKPSTGELKASVPLASNGIFVNNTTVADSYTIATNSNGMSVGPITVNSGVTVTVSSGQRWLVL